jgi:transposase
MGKYSDRTKIAAAEDYCRGHLGLREVAKGHGVNVASLRLWAAAYRIHGAAGVRTKRRKFYSAEFKLSVLQRMRIERLSRRQAAALFNVRRHDMIGVWQRAYESGGVAALHRAAEFRCKAMVKKSKDEPADSKKTDDKRTRQELLEELRRLRMENAYLKKLKALAQAQEPAHDTEPKSCKS